jgi:hypothetical protein
MVIEQGRTMSFAPNNQEVRNVQIEKHPPSPDRVRKIPESFSWVDHRLVREGHINGRSSPALALYLMLLTVADSEGLSYWSEASLARRLSLSVVRLREACAELEAADLVTYAAPIWQVLSLPGGGR